MQLEEVLKQRIREVPNFPIPGVNFKDISPIFLDPELILKTAEALAAPWRGKGITRVIGVESRGFLFGPQIATLLGAGFVIVRKAGKLPPETTSMSYSLEYGNATIEIVNGAIGPDDKVLIHDDLLATGGTAGASAALVKSIGAEVGGFSFLIDLEFLGGKNALKAHSENVHSIIHYS